MKYGEKKPEVGKSVKVVRENGEVLKKARRDIDDEEHVVWLFPGGSYPAGGGDEWEYERPVR